MARMPLSIHSIQHVEARVSGPYSGSFCLSLHLDSDQDEALRIDFWFDDGGFAKSLRDAINSAIPVVAPEPAPVKA